MIIAESISSFGVGVKIIAENKKALFKYEIIEKFKAGIVLTGQEVKSIKLGRINLAGSFVVMKGDEIFLIGAHVPPYQPKNLRKDYNPSRSRKLLLRKTEINQIIGKAIGKEAKIEYPINPEHGDYSTNVAMLFGLKPDGVVSKITKYLTSDVRYGKMFEKVEANQGFVNFFLSKEYLQKQVKEILKQGDDYGSPSAGFVKIRKKKKTQVEFISANPTGPLTLGNGRGGFCGDVLSNVLIKAGFEVEREYYVNDRGEQIKKLGHSVIGDSMAEYKGKYINDLKKKIKSKKDVSPEKVGEKAGRIILREMLKPTVKKMGIKFDNWFSEKQLYTKKEVEKIFKWLRKNELTYEKDNALWFRSTKFGDDKDRVLVKTDGEATYLASDIAYLKNKKDRGFKKLIYFWGADHHGYIKRMQAAAAALGYKEEDVKFVIMQLVRLFRGNKEVRMSKREGTYVTLDELLNEVGLDVARFFFLARSPNSHLNFDLRLAKEQSEKNPVYYVQYAHARIASILAKFKVLSSKFKVAVQSLKLLIHPSELNLIKQLIKLPEVIEDTAQDFQVQRLPKYAMDLAAVFHRFYTDCRVIDEENPKLTQARIALVQAAKIALKNTLALMGITAPEKM